MSQRVRSITLPIRKQKAETQGIHRRGTINMMKFIIWLALISLARYHMVRAGKDADRECYGPITHKLDSVGTIATTAQTTNTCQPQGHSLLTNPLDDVPTQTQGSTATPNLVINNHSPTLPTQASTATYAQNANCPNRIQLPRLSADLKRNYTTHL